MITVYIPEKEMWDDERQEFYYIKKQKVVMEHSLISISKWEMKFHKVFCSKEEKTFDEQLYYFKCMCIGNDDINYEDFKALPAFTVNRIKEYMEDRMTGIKLKEIKASGGGGGDPMSSEMIYYYMIQLDIPFSCEKWHLNRLLALIRICSMKNTPAKKMSPKALAKHNSSLNASRRSALGSKG